MSAPDIILLDPHEQSIRSLLSQGAGSERSAYMLFGVAETLVRHGINLHTAKIATLGARIEDTFLISGPNLGQDSQILRVETELLEKLAV